MPMFWNNLFVVLSLFRGCYLLLFDHLASQKGEIQMKTRTLLVCYQSTASEK